MWDVFKWDKFPQVWLDLIWLWDVQKWRQQPTSGGPSPYLSATPAKWSHAPGFKPRPPSAFSHPLADVMFGWFLIIPNSVMVPHHSARCHLECVQVLRNINVVEKWRNIAEKLATISVRAQKKSEYQPVPCVTYQLVPWGTALTTALSYEGAKVGRRINILRRHIWILFWTC